VKKIPVTVTSVHYFAYKNNHFGYCMWPNICHLGRGLGSKFLGVLLVHSIPESSVSHCYDDVAYLYNCIKVFPMNLV